MSSSYDSRSIDEMDLSKEMNIAMILALHANKRPKQPAAVVADLVVCYRPRSPCLVPPLLP
jgi:hypothetical protein